MPFGLSSAPSTFQSIMNHIIKPYIRRFVLVFFDYIIIYNKTWEIQIQHVDRILQLLQGNKLFVKLSKCSFGMEEVDYLGHIMGRKGVRVDPKFFWTMQDWTQPQTLKSLWGFLGLTRYYHRFVKSYECVSRIVINILKKNAFL